MLALWYLQKLLNSARAHLANDAKAAKKKKKGRRESILSIGQCLHEGSPIGWYCWPLLLPERFLCWHHCVKWLIL